MYFATKKHKRHKKALVAAEGIVPSILFGVAKAQCSKTPVDPACISPQKSTKDTKRL
jgi:hypothetical protein